MTTFKLINKNEKLLFQKSQLFICVKRWQTFKRKNFKEIN